MSTGKELASQIKFKSDYSKWKESTNLLETWEEATDGRIMEMHRINPDFQEAFKNERFKTAFEKAAKAYANKEVLASQRTLQYAIDPIFKKNARLYNCSATYIDRPRVFQEIMWVLLCGAGVGYSVQSKDVGQLPNIAERLNGTKTFVIPDSIEGWADALGVLLSSFFVAQQPFPEFADCKVRFDYSQIREKGSFISGGFKAPGHEGLKDSLEKIEFLLQNLTAKGTSRLTTLNCHDIICHAADAVISGGVRRSALIALFDKEDQEMIECKTGEWYLKNKQRARANNSAILVENQFTKEEFNTFKTYIEQFGEPGFIFVKSDRFLYNPCAEIGFYCYHPTTNESGFNFCNLTEINGLHSTTEQKFYDQVINATVIGTIQAAYTNFEYLGQVSEEICRYEALLGVSITGWMNNPDILFDKEILKAGAELAKETNEWVAQILGINPAARITCAKPSGNASVLLGCASGIHPEHSRRYFRLMQINKQNDMLQHIKEIAPSMVEHSVWSSTNQDDVVYIPTEVSEKTVIKKDLTGVQFLELVNIAKKDWVDNGKRPERCLHPDLSHNISNTVNVDDFNAVFEYLWEHQDCFSGVSFIKDNGDKSYNQAPFTEVLTPDEMIEKYGGEGTLFASGLIVDGLNVFPNLWDALDNYVKVRDKEIPLVGTRQEKILMKDWIRRVKQFSKRYLKGDLNRTIELLLDVNNWHRWTTIKREMRKLDIESFNYKPEYVDADTLASIACQGGACEIPQK